MTNMIFRNLNDIYLEVSSKKKTCSPFYCQARVHIHNFPEVNFQDFVVEPLVQLSQTPVWELLLYHIDLTFSDSRTQIRSLKCLKKTLVLKFLPHFQQPTLLRATFLDFSLSYNQLP